jgi:hypothetical protein
MEGKRSFLPSFTAFYPHFTLLSTHCSPTVSAPLLQAAIFMPLPCIGTGTNVISVPFKWSAGLKEQVCTKMTPKQATRENTKEATKEKVFYTKGTFTPQ